MAAQRRARKPARAGWGTGWARAAAALIWLSLVWPIAAATTEYVVVDRNTGLAIFGFDPIAYFTDRAAMPGREGYEHRHAGAVWRFRNPGNRAAFAADPEVYMPRYGGYDPLSIGHGMAVPGDPREWVVIGERLYLFQTSESRAAFRADSGRTIAAADQAWPTVQLTLSP